MHPALSVVFFVLCILCAYGYPPLDIAHHYETGRVYFPDQAEYIKEASKCPDKLIYWPADRQCYTEGERGPCNVGRLLVFNKILFQPSCKDSTIRFQDE